MNWSDWMSGNLSIQIDALPKSFSKQFPILYKIIKDEFELRDQNKYEYIEGFIDSPFQHFFVNRYSLTVLNDGYYELDENDSEPIYSVFKFFYEFKNARQKLIDKKLMYFPHMCVNERNAEEMKKSIIDKIDYHLSVNKDAKWSDLLKDEITPFLEQRKEYVRSFNPKANPTVEYTELKKVIDYFNNEYKWKPSDSFESLRWDIKKDALIHKLRKRLIDEKFILEKTNKDYFYYVFKGKKLSCFEELSNRIIWNDYFQNILELIFLLRKSGLILKDGLIPKDDKGNTQAHKIYKVVYSCFSMYNDTSGLVEEIPKTRRGNEKLTIQGKTERQKLLATIVSSLLM